VCVFVPLIGLIVALPLPSPANQQQLAKKIVLGYSQRWISHYDRSKLLFDDDRSRPRHLSTGKCLCQFIEEYLMDRPGQQAADVQERSDEAVQTSRDLRPADSRKQCVDRPVWQSRTADYGAQEAGKIAIDMSRMYKEQRNESDIRSRLAESLNLVMVSECRELDVHELIETNEMYGRKGQVATPGSDTLAPPPAESFVVGSHSRQRQRQQQRQQQQQECGEDSVSSSELELSLDSDNEDSLPDRGEELLNGLKLLLKLRANEMSRSLDESSIVTMRNHNSVSPSSTSAHGDECGDGQRSRSQAGALPGDQSNNNQNAADKDKGANAISVVGKKFFARVDGLIPLGLKRGKRRGYYASSSQQLLNIS
jgi:hypothetical protein